MNLNVNISLKKFVSITIITTGFLSALITLYIFLFPPKSISIEYEILSSTNILDIHAELSQLEILYEGKNILDSHENLKLVTLRVSNLGSEHVLLSHYDFNDPLGFILKSGKLAGPPELLGGNNDYLLSNIKLKVDSTKVTFDPIILDSGDFFTIKFLIIHKITFTPEIHPIGKIAGVKNIPLKYANTDAPSSPNFLEILFAGNFFVQISRSLIYTFITLIFVVVIILALLKLKRKKNKIIRSRLVKEFKSSTGYTENKMDQAIFDKYVKKGFSSINRIRRFLRDENLLNEGYIGYLDKKEKRLSESQEASSESSEIRIERRLSKQSPSSSYFEMYQDGYISQNDSDRIVINTHMQHTLKNLINFVKDADPFRKKLFLSKILLKETSSDNQKNS